MNRGAPRGRALSFQDPFSTNLITCEPLLARMISENGIRATSLTAAFPGVRAV